jgi:hypothetical protein
MRAFSQYRHAPAAKAKADAFLRENKSLDNLLERLGKLSTSVAIFHATENVPP